MKILLLADIHGNFPALSAIAAHFADTSFHAIINCGDSLVYAPFANETLRWLRKQQAISILGNTDKKVVRLLAGKDFRKPRKQEKRVMYTTTAAVLTTKNRHYLLSLQKSASLPLPAICCQDISFTQLGIFHGSPSDPDEFLFADTPDSRFLELAEQFPFAVIVTGHSHSPYWKQIGGTHFINPGSAGRMFDGNPAASCAVLDCHSSGLLVQHFRISYDVEQVVNALQRQHLPEIYATMFRLGEKLH